MFIVIECKNICKEYENKIILNNINLKFYLNEEIGIVGNNGCGKSTLIKCIFNECTYDGKLYIGENRKNWLYKSRYR